jgi:hypothetical protein
VETPETHARRFIGRFWPLFLISNRYRTAAIGGIMVS